MTEPKSASRMVPRPFRLLVIVLLAGLAPAAVLTAVYLAMFGFGPKPAAVDYPGLTYDYRPYIVPFEAATPDRPKAMVLFENDKPGYGLGVLVGEKGVFLAPRHVIQTTDTARRRVWGMFRDGGRFESRYRIVHDAPDQDLVLAKIDGPLTGTLVWLPLAAQGPRPGQPVAVFHSDYFPARESRIASERQARRGGHFLPLWHYSWISAVSEPREPCGGYAYVPLPNVASFLGAAVIGADGGLLGVVTAGEDVAGGAGVMSELGLDIHHTLSYPNQDGFMAE